MWDDTIAMLRRLVCAVQESYTAEIATPEDLRAAESAAAWLGSNSRAAQLAVGDAGETYAEVVEQRDALVALLACLAPGMMWKSLRDADGEPVAPGYLLAGIETLSGSIVFRLPLRYASVLHCPSIPKAREGIDGQDQEGAILALARNGCLPY